MFSEFWFDSEVDETEVRRTDHHPHQVPFVHVRYVDFKGD